MDVAINHIENIHSRTSVWINHSITITEEIKYPWSPPLASISHELFNVTRVVLTVVSVAVMVTKIEEQRCKGRKFVRGMTRL